MSPLASGAPAVGRTWMLLKTTWQKPLPLALFGRSSPETTKVIAVVVMDEKVSAKHESSAPDAGICEMMTPGAPTPALNWKPLGTFRTIVRPTIMSPRARSAIVGPASVVQLGRP